MPNPVTNKNPLGAGRAPHAKNKKDVNALFNKLTKAIDKLPQKAINELVKQDPAKYMNILERLQKQRPKSEGEGGTVMKYYFFPASNLQDAKIKTHLMDLYNLLEEKKVKFKKMIGDE